MAEITNLINIDGSNSSNSIIFANELVGGTSSTETFGGEITGGYSGEQIKNRISSIVKHHLPEFIRSDYSLFVYFIEAYYKFLEQDFSPQEIIQDIQTYADIDRTSSAYLYYFLQNYAKDLPLEVLANKRLLIKRLSDLYTAKGSSLSFDILFRVLYNTTVEIQYPYENVLKPSDGNWTQKTSIAVQVVSGTRDSIVNRFLSYTYNGALFETPILNTKQLLNNTVEITLDNNRLATGYTEGDFVYVYGNLGEIIFKGRILSSPVSYSILQAGSGFKIGQIFNINYSANVGSIIKVTSVTPTGGIDKLKIINFGYGYPNNFQINLDKDSPSSKIIDAIASSTKGSSEELTIFKIVSGDSNRYFDTDYTSDQTYTAQYEFKTSTSSISGELPEQSIPGNYATLLFKTGAVARYPGAFSTNRGFLSENDIRLEDDLLYQPFAYQTNTDLDISKFYDTIIKLIHPAGQRLFNNRTLNNVIDVSSSVLTSGATIGEIGFESYASVDPGDALSVQLRKAFSGEDFTTETDQSNLNIDKIISDTLDPLETVISSFSTVIDDIVIAEDVVSIDRNKLPESLVDPLDTTALSINRSAIEITVDPIDEPSVSFATSTSDNVSEPQDTAFVLYNNVTSDVVENSDNSILQINILTSDTQSQLDDGYVMVNPDTYSTGFFEEDHNAVSTSIF